MSSRKNLEIIIVFLSSTPLILFLIDHALFSTFYSKYEFKHLSLLLTAILFFIIFRSIISLKKFKTSLDFEQRDSLIKTIKKIFLRLIGFSLYGFICFIEFNRLPAIAYTFSKGTRHTIMVDVAKRHSSSKSSCSGRDELSFDLTKKDIMFHYCIPKEQAIKFSDTNRKVKFSVLESSLGIVFFDIQPIAS